jgi:hypothetical protein
MSSKKKTGYVLRLFHELCCEKTILKTFVRRISTNSVSFALVLQWRHVFAPLAAELKHASTLERGLHEKTEASVQQTLFCFRFSSILLLYLYYYIQSKRGVCPNIIYQQVILIIFLFHLCQIIVKSTSK